MSYHLNVLKKALFLTVIILAGMAAKASDDILIIDVNNVLPEIDHIHEFIKSEQAQGRELDTKIVIVPSEERLPMETRRKIQDLHLTLIDSNASFFADHCQVSAMNANPRLKEKCQRALDIANPARIEADRLVGGSAMNGSFRVSDIEEELKKALDGPYQFSRVIISGHHGPARDPNVGMLSGELYAGFTSKLAQQYLNSSPSTRDVRSVIMLGCWTGVEDMLRNAWGQVLPQAAFHSGFVEKAPAKFTATNVMILDSLLRNEALIGASKSEAELRQNYAKLKMGDRDISVLVNGVYLSRSGLKKSSKKMN
jgi:hypothetical protein